MDQTGGNHRLAPVDETEILQTCDSADQRPATLVKTGAVDLKRLLEGHLDNLPPLPARVVRVFLSSTFSDMILERNALMESVYPRLKDFCREKFRLEFQVIDLRWGLRDQSQDDHTIVEFCIKEIENCLKSSAGPNFVALLGQKYGYRSFPARISAEQFELICSVLESKSRDVSVLVKWYKKDLNVIPHIYTLQPISIFLPHYIDNNDTTLRAEAEQEWNNTFSHIQSLLREGALACWEQGRISQRDKDLYFISVTEYEIEEGLLTVSDPISSSFCITRHITNLEDSIQCRRAPKFIDICKDEITGEPAIDTTAQQMLKVLREQKIPDIYKGSCFPSQSTSISHTPTVSTSVNQDNTKQSNGLIDQSSNGLIDNQDNTKLSNKLNDTNYEATSTNKFFDRHDGFTPSNRLIDRPNSASSFSYSTTSDNLHHFRITWANPEWSNPAEQKEYLHKFCATFEDQMSHQIERCMMGRQDSARSTQSAEVHQHLMMCRTRSDLFRGREEVLEKIRQYLVRPAEYPLVIYGMSGSGKTSVMAKSASLVRFWCDGISSPSDKVAKLEVPSSPDAPKGASSALTAEKTYPAQNASSGKENQSAGPSISDKFKVGGSSSFSGKLSRRKNSFFPGKAAARPSSAFLTGYTDTSSDTANASVSKAAADKDVTKETPVILNYPTVIMRFLGTTAHSCSIRLVLENLCWHLITLRGEETSRLPGDYPSLVNLFHDLLRQTKGTQPVVLILDSLDQLSPAHRAHNLAWLPRTLPPHVHILLSTLPTEHGLLDTLRALIPIKQNFLEITSLGQRLSVELVGEWLKSSGRAVTQSQYEIMKEALSKCSLPLYARLVFEEVSRWTSYASPETTRLEYTVKGIICKLLERLERYQGKIFVSHALAYLTASKNGLSNVELEDVLSLDEFVLNDVFQHWIPPLRRIPPLLLPRLHDQLSSYIVQREANGTVVFYWYHNQFIHVARERYLAENHHRIYIHGILSHYYLGTWGGGKGKAFKYSAKHLQLMSVRVNKVAECTADRKVPLQPVQFGPDPLNPNAVNYNLRKLSELPYHLTESRQFFDLKQEVLLNYEFLHAKLTAMSIHDILADFRMAIDTGVRDPEVQLVYSALRVCGTYVNQNPNTLGFDLLGRLLVYYNDKLSIRNLLQQCDLKSTVHSSLLPLYQCFESPRAMLLYVLEEHDQSVVDLVFSQQDLISISRDGVMMFWDLTVGECTMSIKIPGAGRSPLGMNTKLYISSDNKYLVVDSDVINSPVYVYDLKTAQLLHRCGRRSPNQRRGFLVGHLMCRQKNIIDISRGVVVGAIDKFVNSKRYLTCTITPNQKSLLIGDEREIRMFDIDDGLLVTTFPSENPPSVFHITEDCKRCYVGYIEDCLFKVLDIDRTSDSLGEALLVFNYKTSLATSAVRLLEGSKYCREVSEIALSPANEDDVVLNIRRCNLIYVNIQTGEAKIFDVRPAFDGRTFKPNEISFFNVSYSFDGQRVIAGEDCYIHVWDTKTMKFICSVQLHTNFPFPLSVSRTRNVMASGSSMHTSIKIWDLSRLDVKDSIGVKTYENPLDLITVAAAPRFVFIKKYYPISSNKGYQYVDSFGIDVWNVNTGNCSPFLVFNRYGRLLQMEVSPDGTQIALLLSVRDTYVSVLNTRLGKIMCNIEIPSCQFILPSTKWDFLVTGSTDNGVKEIRLWNLTRQGELVHRFSQVHSPVFTLDGQYLLFIDSFQMLITYSLTKMAPVQFMSAKGDNLIPLPVHHGQVISQTCSTSTGSENQSADNASVLQTNVSVWDIHDYKLICTLSGVSPSGIKDISKDGRLGVDGYLQVFDLSSGKLVRRVGNKSSASSNSEASAQQPAISGTNSSQQDSVPKSAPSSKAGSDAKDQWMFVRFTYDGLYVIHVDDLSVQVSSVETGCLVAHATTHERVTSLLLLDYGYVLVLGREDGRLLTMKLIHESSSHAQHFPLSLTARADFLMHGMAGCPEHLVSTFDTNYQTAGQYCKDTDMPKATEAIRSVLSSRARVPRAVITTPKTVASTMPSSVTALNTAGATILAAGITSGKLGDLNRFIRQNTSLSSGGTISGSSVDYGTTGEESITDPTSPTSPTMKSHLTIHLEPSKLKDSIDEGGKNGINSVINGTEHNSRPPTSPKSLPATPNLGRQKSKSRDGSRGPRSPSAGRSFSPSNISSTIQSYLTPVLTPLMRRLSPRTTSSPTTPSSQEDSGTSASPISEKPPSGLNARSMSSDSQADEFSDFEVIPTTPLSPVSPTSTSGSFGERGRSEERSPRLILTDVPSSPSETYQRGPFTNIFNTLTRRAVYQVQRSKPVSSQSTESQSSENHPMGSQSNEDKPIKQPSNKILPLESFEDQSAEHPSDNDGKMYQLGIPSPKQPASSAPSSPYPGSREKRPQSAATNQGKPVRGILRTLRDLTPVRAWKKSDGKPPIGKSISSEKEDVR